MTRHGHYLGYITDGCRCEDCTRAWNVYRQRSDLLRLRNRHRLVDPTAAVAIADEKAQAWGVTTPRVLEAAGMHLQGAHELINGNQKRMDRAHAAAVDHVTLHDLDPATWMDAAPVRDLRDTIMERTGRSTHQLAEDLGVSRELLRFRGDRCRVGTWQALTAEMDRLDRPRCETCGDDPMPGGARQCARCFSRATWPSRSDMDLTARREQDRLRKRAERAARREVAA